MHIVNKKDNNEAENIERRFLFSSKKAETINFWCAMFQKKNRIVRQCVALIQTGKENIIISLADDSCWVELELRTNCVCKNDRVNDLVHADIFRISFII